MQIDLSKFLVTDGTEETLLLENVLQEVTVSGECYPVSQDEPLELVLKNEGEQILSVRCSGAVRVLIPCARCLEPVAYSMRFCSERKADMKKPDEEREEDAFFIIEKTLHADLLVMDEILQQWPIRVLCKADCKGLCSQCGANLNREVCTCDRKVPDPRMAAIRDIFSQNKEV